jgi:hypothetical protein
MKNNKKIFCVFMIGILVLSLNVSAIRTSQTTAQDERTDTLPTDNYTQCTSTGEDDLDPLVDLEVTVTIKEIRALDKIDDIGQPDFFVVVFINDEKFRSNIWFNQKYISEPWSATLNVPDEIENVTIKIQLWDWNLGLPTICDLNADGGFLMNTYDINLVYNLKIAHWTGDDYNYPAMNWGDPSGYGRANGCDDNSIYQDDNDCLILFDITQTDYDGDGIPYWTEVNRYHTDPEINDLGRDDDGDGIPIEWEFKWGTFLDYDWHSGGWRFVWYYDPFEWDDHENIDVDNDGLNNVEEYLTSEWGSDPFRKDIFVELDQMEAGPNGEPASIFPEAGKDMLRDAFDRQNICFHLDDGSMGGGEWIPFDIETPREELVELYRDYFLHGDKNNWRRGAFHYGLFVYDATFEGYMFGTGDGYWGAYQISSSRMNKHAILHGKPTAIASVYMHELGHTLDIYIPGGHDTESNYPWKLGWWKWRPYKSCMNYGYTYVLVDYSDGSRGKRDHDDWSTLDLLAFQSNLH